MYDTVYLNGEYLKKNKACISIEDRGTIFGDGIYEVFLNINGKIPYFNYYLDRLYRSLKEAKIALDISKDDISNIVEKLIGLNEVTQAVVYLEVTRGTAIRDHKFPNDVTPNFFVILYPYNLPKIDTNAMKCKSHLDIRWGRCDIKSTSIMANVLLKQNAIDSGFDEMILFDKENYVTECTKYNCFFINQKNQICTREDGYCIMSGVTRRILFECANDLGYEVVKGKFTLEDFKNAKEVFATTTRQFISPITQIDDKIISDGEIGVITRNLYEELYKNIVSYCEMKERDYCVK